MNRARRFAPLLVAGGALALLVAGIGFDTVGGSAWRYLLIAAGIAACTIGYRTNRLPWMFPAVVALGGVRVVMIDGYPSTDRAASLSLINGLADAAVGLALVVILAMALRFRRGELDDRDTIDLATVAVGAALSTWIVVTSRLIFVQDIDPLMAISASFYPPIAALLFTFVIDLTFTGLRSNRTMQLFTLGAALNLAGTVGTSFHLVGLAMLEPETEIALFGAAFLLLAAGLAHRDAPETLDLDPSQPKVVAYTPLRLVLTGACLVVPGVLVASLAPFDPIDVTVRVVALVVLICAVVIRLFIAVRSHENAHEALMQRLDLDDLTKLPTRACFVREVDNVLEATWRSEFRPTIIQLDLDRFKNINDSLGHYEANDVLITVGQRLSAAAVSFDGIVARAGGDDFVIIDRGTKSPSEAMERVELVRSALASPVRVGDASVFVTASFGVAVAPRHRTLTAEELMRRADIATHRAKGTGRNSVVLFDDSMQSHLAHRMDVEHALHGAIGRQEMHLYYQPIVDITNGGISGFEALIRWQRDGVIVAPIEFIPIAEDTGLIRELGAWALHQALNELRGWIDDGVVGPNATISVNVSPRQIADPEFADVVRGALRDTGMPAGLLWLEMTESMMLEEPEIAEATLRKIREMGVRLALDDFGTGYSSLSLLQQFPIQRIKIDRAFVNGIADDNNDRSLVRTIIAMAQSMGLDLVAEGVETVHQLRVLTELQCDKAQGFLISHPVPADAMRSTMVALGEFASLSLFGATPESFSPQKAIPVPTVRRSEFSARRSNGSPVSVGSVSSRPLGQPVL